MTKIILYGDRKDKSITSELCRTLEEYGGVLYVCEGNIVQYGIHEPEYIIIETDKIDTLRPDFAIIVFKSIQNNNMPNIRLYDRVIAITESDNPSALSKLKFLPVPTIGCGMSSRDTLTLSSKSEKEATVSVQRALPLPHNKCLEPCEIKVNLSKESLDYAILSVTAILLLSDKTQNGYLNI